MFPDMESRIQEGLVHGLVDTRSGSQVPRYTEDGSGRLSYLIG